MSIRRATRLVLVFMLALAGTVCITLRGTSARYQSTESIIASVDLTAADVAPLAVTNLAEVEELDTEPGPPLGTPKLSETLADGATPTWVGPMIAQGSAVPQVYLLRN